MVSQGCRKGATMMKHVILPVVVVIKQTLKINSQISVVNN